MALLATFHGGTTATSVNNLLSESGLAHPFAAVFGPGGNLYVSNIDHTGGLAIVGIGSGG